MNWVDEWIAAKNEMLKRFGQQTTDSNSKPIPYTPVSSASTILTRARDAFPWERAYEISRKRNPNPPRKEIQKPIVTPTGNTSIEAVAKGEDKSKHAPYTYYQCYARAALAIAGSVNPGDLILDASGVYFKNPDGSPVYALRAPDAINYWYNLGKFGREAAGFTEAGKALAELSILSELNDSWDHFTVKVGETVGKIADKAGETAGGVISGLFKGIGLPGLALVGGVTYVALR